MAEVQPRHLYHLAYTESAVRHPRSTNFICPKPTSRFNTASNECISITLDKGIKNHECCMNDLKFSFENDIFNFDIEIKFHNSESKMISRIYEKVCMQHLIKDLEMCRIEKHFNHLYQAPADLDHKKAPLPKFKLYSPKKLNKPSL